MESKFGAALRRIRHEKQLRLVDMANVLNVSIAWISAVETGRKEPSKEFIELFCTRYSITQQQKDELEVFAAEDKESVEITFGGNSHPDARNLAVAFARRFPDFKPTEIRDLMSTLKRLDKGGS